MKKVFCLILALTMVFALAACSTAPAEKTYRVGIVQLAQHPALDAATQGFMDTLKEKLGDKVTFDNQNASGETANCAIIVNGFVSDNVDLIMANATPAVQAAASATATIPVLGTSVTEYGTALSIDNFSGTVGTNVSGTSDLAPLDEQAAIIKEWFPDAASVGLLYCSAEANSIYQVKVMQEELTKLGYAVTLFSFNDTNDVASVTQTACDNVDVIYIPTDNIAANNTEAIANVVLPAGVPVVTGEESMCKGCGVATLSISYYDLGCQTGEMAYKILTGAEKVESMPIAYAPNVTKKYNAANVAALGLTVPDGYEAIAD
ncbi:MAG: ABC transporter substrate-binding protein [Oscillospiraceae bacterium]|nr:ABC transporter substrate-binding protein [Oscillospiraceae bacterium]